MVSFIKYLICVAILFVLFSGFNKAIATEFDYNYLCIVDSAQVYKDEELTVPGPKLTYWTPLRVEVSTRLGHECGNGWYKLADGSEIVCDSNMEEQYFGEAWTVIANTLNIRSGPGLSYKIIKQLSRGEVVAHIPGENSTKEADGHEWIKVILPDKTSGWTAVEYLVDHRAFALFEELDQIAETGDLGTLKYLMDKQIKEAIKLNPYYDPEYDIWMYNYYISPDSSYIIYVNSEFYDGSVVFKLNEGITSAFNKFIPEEILWSQNSRYYSFLDRGGIPTSARLALFDACDNKLLIYYGVENATDHSLPRMDFPSDNLFAYVDYDYDNNLMPRVWILILRLEKRI